MKLSLNIDSTILGSSHCILKFARDLFGDIQSPELGGYKQLPNASMIYGVACHKFRDVMYKTGGHYPTARAAAEKVFNVPKLPPSDKKGHISDPRHLITTCFMVWSEYIEKEGAFDLVMLPSKCYWCDGKGKEREEFCSKCNGTGIRVAPASELSFKIPFYEDEILLINLCGTLDGVGKINGGCYAIPDFKFTSAWNKDEYLESYELSRQLRMYRLACKLMAERNPESVLGKIGATNMGAFIDGVFIKPKANDVEFKRSQVFIYSKEDIEAFERELEEFCSKLSSHIANKYFPKEGIRNGTCEGKWHPCSYWHCCKSNNKISDLLLKRDFKRKVYDPLNFHEG